MNIISTTSNNNNTTLVLQHNQYKANQVSETFLLILLILIGCAGIAFTFMTS